MAAARNYSIQRSEIMTPEITTLPALAPAARAKTLLAKDAITCTLLTLAPGAETPRSEAGELGEQLLVVLDGQATVRFPEVSTMLNTEGALLIAAGATHSVAASAAYGARLLRIDLPMRRAAEPVLHSFDH